MLLTSRSNINYEEPSNKFIFDNIWYSRIEKEVDVFITFKAYVKCVINLNKCRKSRATSAYW
jgi:hypothetical protein